MGSGQSKVNERGPDAWPREFDASTRHQAAKALVKCCGWSPAQAEQWTRTPDLRDTRTDEERAAAERDIDSHFSLYGEYFASLVRTTRPPFGNPLPRPVLRCVLLCILRAGVDQHLAPPAPFAALPTPRSVSTPLTHAACYNPDVAHALLDLPAVVYDDVGVDTADHAGQTPLLSALHATPLDVGLCLRLVARSSVATLNHVVPGSGVCALDVCARLALRPADTTTTQSHGVDVCAAGIALVRALMARAHEDGTGLRLHNCPPNPNDQRTPQQLLQRVTPRSKEPPLPRPPAHLADVVQLSRDLDARIHDIVHYPDRLAETIGAAISGEPVPVPTTVATKDHNHNHHSNSNEPSPRGGSGHDASTSHDDDSSKNDSHNSGKDDDRDDSKSDNTNTKADSKTVSAGHSRANSSQNGSHGPSHAAVAVTVAVAAGGGDQPATLPMSTQPKPTPCPEVLACVIRDYAMPVVAAAPVPGAAVVAPRHFEF